ncbi:protein tilB homolog [Lineus longissimus]|uniref:protein tilB homolog n=1 Tax=Lineus longissimus TaxID=88925 RepID=UPI002B4EB585
MSDFSGPNVSLAIRTEYEEKQILQKNGVEILPKLPSHRYKHTVWHELSHTEIHGPVLWAPRIRDGPQIKEETFHTVTDDAENPIHHGKMGKERKNYRNQMEDWESAEFCNLSYQDLGDKYQQDNFKRVLKRLVNAREINLVEDTLVNLSSIKFPACTHLNLTKNYLNSLNCLPELPHILWLNLSYNNIHDLDGLKSLKKTPLKSLVLKGNPVEFKENYRPRVFGILPQLKLLDNIPRLPSEMDEITEEEENAKRCTIS